MKKNLPVERTWIASRYGRHCTYDQCGGHLYGIDFKRGQCKSPMKQKNDISMTSNNRPEWRGEGNNMVCYTITYKLSNDGELLVLAQDE